MQNNRPKLTFIDLASFYRAENIFKNNLKNTIKYHNQN